MGQSTRKNPDKLIAQLKKRLERVERWYYSSQDLIFQERAEREKEVARLQGKHWFSPSEGSTYSSNLTDPYGSMPHLNQEVVIKGRITELKRTISGEYPSRFVISFTNLSLKETP